MVAKFTSSLSSCPPEFHFEKEVMFHQMNQVFISKRNHSHDRRLFSPIYPFYSSSLGFAFLKAWRRPLGALCSFRLEDNFVPAADHRGWGNFLSEIIQGVGRDGQDGQDDENYQQDISPWGIGPKDLL
jgi:hypothetical protein